MKETFEIIKDYILEGNYCNKGCKITIMEENEIVIGSEESKESIDQRAMFIVDMAIEKGVITENDFEKIEAIKKFFMTKYLENPQNVPTLEDVKNLVKEIDDNVVVDDMYME